MKYLSKIRNLPLILGAGGTGILKWWIDTSFTVHPNRRVYAGEGLYIGSEFPAVTFTKHDLNNQRST